MNGEAAFDTVVVGAGVIGLSIAYELLRRERSVLVVERDRPGAGASHVAGGMLAPVCEAEDQPPVLTDLCLDSAERYAEFVGELERVSGGATGYREEGTLWVALHRDDVEELARLESTLALRELPFEHLTAERIKILEPHLSPRVLGGLHVAGDRQVDPRALLQVLQRAVQRLGGRFLCPSTVTEVLAENGRATGVRAVAPEDAGGGEQLLRASNVVLAAGAWTTERIRFPDPAAPVRPVKGQLVRLCGETLIGHVVRSPDVYLIPRKNGELLLGATVEEMGFDTEPNAGAVMDLLRHAWEVLPGTYDLGFAGVDVGLRPATEDHLPRIGPTGLEGLYLATGHYRNGILLAPVTAVGIADWISGKRPDERVAVFDPRRISAGEAVP